MKPVPSRILGLSKVILNIIWISIGVLAIIYGLRGLNSIKVTIINNLKAVDSNIKIVKRLLVESIDVVDSVDQSISTIEQSSIDAGLSLIETRPMINKTSQVVTQDLPFALSEIQTSMPSVINAAEMIDRTLYILSGFRFSIPNPFGTDFEISLGVDYQPEIPLQDALSQLSWNLEGIPERMGSLEGDLSIADTNLGIMSENLIDVAYDLDIIREQIEDIVPQLELMITNLETVQTSIENSKERLPKTFDIVRNVFIGLMALFILSQAPSIYIGYLFIKGEFIKPNGNAERKG